MSVINQLNPSGHSTIGFVPNPRTMRMERYDDIVAFLMKDCGTLQDNLNHMALGAAGEVGELIDAIKRHTIYGKDLDLENVDEELGDTLFYLTGMMVLLGLDPLTILQNNVTKLMTKRYPTGYTDAAAIARADKIEDKTPTKILVISENAPIPYGSVVDDVVFNVALNMYEGIHSSRAGSYEVQIKAEDCKVIS